MINRSKKLAVIHIAKKQLALDDEAYRALLFGAAGVESAGHIKSEVQYRKIMEAFHLAGYKTKSGQKRDRQLDKCYALWCELYHAGGVKSKSRQSMMAWIQGRTGGCEPRLLRTDQKSLMIEELKAWFYRVQKERFGEGKVDRDR